MDLILHLGAHRTGSTALEQALSANAERLARKGVAILKPGRLRRLPDFGRVPALAAEAGDQARARLVAAQSAFRAAAEATGAGCLLLSEENMIGSIEPNLREASLYPQAAARLAAYAAFFDAPARRIGLGLRSDAAHAISGYGYVLRRRPMPPLETMTDDLSCLGTSGRRGWRDVVDDIAAVFPEAEILVWPCEIARGGATPAIAAALAGHHGMQLRVGPGRVNAGPRADAIPQIHALREEAPDLTDAALDARLAALPPPKPYRPFTPDQLARLEARYARDLAELGAMARVTVWQGDAGMGQVA